MTDWTDYIGLALGTDRTARIKFDLDDVKTHNLPHMHPGAAALLVVREALADYELPSPPKLRYRGMRRNHNAEHGHGADSKHDLNDGVVWVEATFRSKSGHNNTVDVPVLVHDAKHLEPEVMVHQGRVMVMAQSAFDEVVGNTEVYDRIRARQHVFSVAETKGAAERGVEKRVNEGLFGRNAQRTAQHDDDAPIDLAEYGFDPSAPDQDEQDPLQLLKQKWDESVERNTPKYNNYYVVGRGGAEQGPLWMDVSEGEVLLRGGPNGHALWSGTHGEFKALQDAGTIVKREEPMNYQGAAQVGRTGRTAGKAKLKHALELQTRGGGTYTLAAGTKCCVLRDMAGDGSMLYVDFGPGVGRAAVPGDAVT